MKAHFPSFSGEKRISNKQNFLSRLRMLYRYKSTNESESTKSTDESEDPSGTLSGENEDGSESFESAFESHNPCNEPNINRVIDDFKSEVMGELLEIKRELKKKDNTNLHELLEMKREMKKKDNFVLDLLGRLDANQGQQNDAVMDDLKSEVMGELLEIKREMKKKDNVILDLLGRLDANQGQQNDTNQGQQNGQTRQSTSPQDTPMGQQTVHANQNKNRQSYATTVKNQPVGMPLNQRSNNQRSKNQGSNIQGQQVPPAGTKTKTKTKTNQGTTTIETKVNPDK